MEIQEWQKLYLLELSVMMWQRQGQRVVSRKKEKKVRFFQHRWMRKCETEKHREIKNEKQKDRE